MSNKKNEMATRLRLRSARSIINSKYYCRNRMERMDRECSFYIDQVYSARNGILRKAFAKMAWIYYRRYEYYLKKCTGYGLRKSIQETTGEDGNLPKGNGQEAGPNTVSTMED